MKYRTMILTRSYWLNSGLISVQKPLCKIPGGEEPDIMDGRQGDSVLMVISRELYIVHRCLAGMHLPSSGAW